MTPEEYERLKEAEKEHLRKMRRLKQAVHELERQKKVSKAVRGITDEPRRLLDEQEELVDRIAMEAAMSEARLDIALESADAKAAVEPERISPEEADEELRRVRARELVKRMRAEDAPDGRSQEEASAAESPSPDPVPDEDPAPPSLPDKTIGRMKP